MCMSSQIVQARFLERPNRFLGIVSLDGERTPVFIPNPGRMHELLIPGRTVYLRPASGVLRKTAYDMIAVDHDGLVISLDANLPNRFMKQMLLEHALPQFRGYERVIPEPPLYGGRADFRLESTDSVTMIEVKSVTLVVERRALFPDAVTKRGARHMHHLAKVLEEGIADRAAVVFVIQRPDADSFAPNVDTDPAFAEALSIASRAGVEIVPLLTDLHDWKLRLIREVPYNLDLTT